MREALYYPTIEFLDPNTLKKALLVWDKVFRIVPSTYEPHDPTEIREAQASGAIINISVDREEKARAAEGFLDLYRVRQDPRVSLVWPAGFSSPAFVRINHEKIDGRLLPLFEQLSRSIDKDGFFDVREDLVGGYMFYLAYAVCSARSLQMLTDSADSWVVGTYFAQQANFAEAIQPDLGGSQLCSLTAEEVLPDLSDVPMEIVLRFVEEHRGEREQFRMALDGLRAELGRCSSREHADYIRDEFVSRLVRSKEEYKKATGFFGKRERLSALAYGVPTTMAVLSLPGADDPYSLIRLGAGLLLGAVAALAGRELITHKEPVGSYLVGAHDLTDSSATRMRKLFEEFIND
jgi:hypothetical protein